MAALDESSSNLFMIDEAYEFSAPRFYDFMCRETDEDVRKAELWFENARPYAPSRAFASPFFLLVFSIYWNSDSGFLCFLEFLDLNVDSWAHEFWVVDFLNFSSTNVMICRVSCIVIYKLIVFKILGFLNSLIFFSEHVRLSWVGEIYLIISCIICISVKCTSKQSMFCNLPVVFRLKNSRHYWFSGFSWIYSWDCSDL